MGISFYIGIGILAVLIVFASFRVAEINKASKRLHLLITRAGNVLNHTDSVTSDTEKILRQLKAVAILEDPVHYFNRFYGIKEFETGVTVYVKILRYDRLMLSEGIDIPIKNFPYEGNSKEDKDFARREAEELLDKLHSNGTLTFTTHR